jgi:hypothetical protein
VSAIADSVAVGLSQAALADEIACDLKDATDMPASGRHFPGDGPLRHAHAFFFSLSGVGLQSVAAGACPEEVSIRRLPHRSNQSRVSH